MRQITEQLSFDFDEGQPPRRSLKEFKAKWYGNCEWCPAKDVPIFCHVGNDAVCADCFTAAVNKLHAN